MTEYIPGVFQAMKIFEENLVRDQILVKGIGGNPSTSKRKD